MTIEVSGVMTLLQVFDMPAAVRFYRDVLGFEIVRTTPREGDQFDWGLLRLNGTPKEVLEHPELMELMLPLLRADFSVVETYDYRPGVPLDCPLTVFGGLRDAEVSREQLEAWREQTTSEFALRMLPGDHFFLNDAQAQTLLLSAVARDLYQLLKRPT